MNEHESTLRDIEIEYNRKQNELIIVLSQEGIKYFQNILDQLQNAEVDSHWHIDDFSGWLGGEFKHLIIIKKEI